jgi:NAD(P)-dependent dehydrogenase (short-subunit alcohol dehydrogenase family)
LGSYGETFQEIFDFDFSFADDIVQESGNDNVIVRHLDLASLWSVRQFASEILKNEPRLDILINNAGCVTMEKKLTPDGLEYQMQANHFGHFLLTNLLLGRLRRIFRSASS